MKAGEFDKQGVRVGRATGAALSWFTENPALSNALCPYCSRPVVGPSAVPSNKEHLIARQFGPSRALVGNEFNLIFRACVSCNARKADLERHVSSITMFNGPGQAEDLAAADAAVRKSLKDFHPAHPGVRVADSHRESEVTYKSPMMDATFGMVGPPQLHMPFALELAFMQVQGFHAFIRSRDYRSPEGVAVLQEKDFQVFGFYSLQDWGNPQLLEVANRVRDWEPLVSASTANGYFKADIRMVDGRGWFWALEWNRFMRVVGGMCDEPMPLFKDLPGLNWFSLPGGTGRARREVPLEGEDLLFIPTSCSSASTAPGCD
jgi:hypothetical protein